MTRQPWRHSVARANPLSRRRDVIIACLAVAAVGIAAVAVSFASLQQDLAAYWIAGKTRWLGLNPYVNYGGSAVAPGLWDGVAPYRHSRFLYPPLAAELFRLLALIPYRAAKVLFTGAAVAGWLLTARLIARRPGGAPSHGLAVVVAGALFFPLYLHLERGQIDLLLLPIVIGTWLRRGRPVVAGAALALAATFKPALLGVLPVLVALGRRRWALATLGWSGVAVGLSLGLSGPGMVREYATAVLPRAALYGEGGTADMLLHEGTLPFTDEDGETAALDGRTYKITIPPFDGTASASLPRLLAPREPGWASSLLPYLLVIGGLAWVALRLPRRQEEDDDDDDDPGMRYDPVVDDAELMLFSAAILACVVTSPTGWVMSFVWALPIAPFVWTAAGRARLSRQALAFLGAVWIACALLPLANGWGALAGTVLVAAATFAADRWVD